MEQTNRQLYVGLMTEIKHRTDYIRMLGTNPSLGMYNWTYIESICLQIRMILENIALGCLVANGDKLEDLPKRIEKEYHAEEILRRLDQVHPDCFPKPTVLIREDAPPDISEDLQRKYDKVLKQHPQGGYLGKWVDRPPGDWLTRGEFREVYGRLGQILHARNPLGSKVDFKYYSAMAPEWSAKVVNLLNHHQIAVVEEGKIYVVQMHSAPEGASPDVPREVKLTEFQAL